MLITPPCHLLAGQLFQQLDRLKRCWRMLGKGPARPSSCCAHEPPLQGHRQHAPGVWGIVAGTLWRWAVCTLDGTAAPGALQRMHARWTLFQRSCAVQIKFHGSVRIGAPTGKVHELWALFQTLDTLDGATSTHAQDFVHGALHPDPRVRMSPAEMCLHPFMDEARDALLAQRHGQGRESPADWSLYMDQLRLWTPTAKGRGPEARAVSMCSSLLLVPDLQVAHLLVLQAVPVAALCTSPSDMRCSGLAPDPGRCCSAVCAT